MSGKAIIAHDKSVAPEALIKAIGGAGLKATREGEKSDDDAYQAQKQRLPRIQQTPAAHQPPMSARDCSEGMGVWLRTLTAA